MTRSGPLHVLGCLGALSLASAIAPACSNDLPPLGEALIIVDSDARVPYFNRMRVDLYSADGVHWIESRDVSLRDARDWPASFSVYNEDESHDKVALVRVRLYLGGQERDYHGERLTIRDGSGAPGDTAIPPPPTCGSPEICELPRVEKGSTPVTEPDPYLALDRLVKVRLHYGTRGQVVLLMRGNCIGTMADIKTQTTCVDTDGVTTAVTEAKLDPNINIPAPVPVTFGPPQSCPDTAKPRPPSSGKRLFDEDVCVSGGTFVFGNAVAASSTAESGAPQRIARLPPFYIDKYEVTVGRWRDAIARGFKPPSTPFANPVPLNRDTCTAAIPSDTSWCTYTAAPGVPEDREAYPVSCVSWAAAEAFCQFEGGDLPTEAQWEYVAQLSGRDAKSDYPWGTDPPTCRPTGATTGTDRAVFSRIWECATTWHKNGGCIATIPNSNPAAACNAGENNRVNCGGPMVSVNPRQGPQPANAVDTPDGDRSVGLGIVNLFGGVNEYTYDSFYSLGSQCWATAPQISPSCFDPDQPLHTLRGGSWVTGAGPTARIKPETTALSATPPQIGFRCARPLEAPL